jgi:hypothetical protein
MIIPTTVLEAMLRIALYQAVQEAAQYRGQKPYGKRRFRVGLAAVNHFFVLINASLRPYPSLSAGLLRAERRS